MTWFPLFFIFGILAFITGYIHRNFIYKQYLGRTTLFNQIIGDDIELYKKRIKVFGSYSTPIMSYRLFITLWHKSSRTKKENLVLFCIILELIYICMFVFLFMFF